MPVKGRSLKDTRGSLGGKVGRPRAECPADAAQRIRELAADGWSLVGIAEKLGTNRHTLADWFDNDPALQEAMDRGREQERQILHNVLFRLAVEQNDKTAAIMILNARHGWRGDPAEAQGNRVSINFTLPGAMRPEQFVIEQNDESNPENLALPRTNIERS